MAWQDGAIYWICPVDHYDVALSVRGDSQVSQNRDVFLYSKEDIADQLWKIDLYDGFARIKSTLDENYALNIYLSTGNCDIHTWADNLEDSKINFRTIDGDRNIYRLQNYRNNNENNNLYLTASSTASGASVTWQGLNEANSKQIWRLIKKSDGNPGGGETGGGETGSSVVEIANLKNYNYNQKEGPTEAFKNSGCACVCGMDVASFYDKRPYSFADFKNYYSTITDEDGSQYVSYSWKTPNFEYKADLAPNGKNEADTIAYIKQYIDAGIPPLCHCVKVTKSQHWVVPFKYEDGSGWDSIWVLDPYQGVERRMSEAMYLSCGGTSGGVDRIMHHEKYCLDPDDCTS